MEFLKSDGTGAGLLKEWIQGLRTATNEKAPKFVAQRLLHPGINPVDGPGFLGAERQFASLVPGSAGPIGVSVLHAIRPPESSEADQVEFDALLGALLTFATNRRCQVLPEILVPIEGSDSRIIVPLTGVSDPTLNAPLPSWDNVNRDVLDVIARITSLDDGSAGAICAALHLHYCASILVLSDLVGAYSLLVAGIEVLAKKFGPSFTAWEDWDHATSWDRFFSRIQLDDEQAAALRERLLEDKPIKLAESFSRYVAENIPMEFWEEPTKLYTWKYDAETNAPMEGSWTDLSPPHSYSDRDEVKQAFKRAYGIRSSYMHAGERNASFASNAFRAAMKDPRPTPTLGQLRASLRFLIQKEVQRGDPSLAGLEDTGIFWDAPGPE